MGPIEKVTLWGSMVGPVEKITLWVVHGVPHREDNSMGRASSIYSPNPGLTGVK